MKLTATKIKSLREPGKYGDGGGLYLIVTRTGSRNWIHRAVVNGKRCDLGLGRFPDVSLAQARDRCADNRKFIADGIDPRERKRQEKVRERKLEAAAVTFREAAGIVHEHNRPTWRNEKHAVSWWQTLERPPCPGSGTCLSPRLTERPCWMSCFRSGQVSLKLPAESVNGCGLCSRSIRPLR